MKKLTIIAAMLALFGVPASANVTFDDLRQCIDDGRVAVLSERTGDVLYYNWATVDCAQIAMAFEPGSDDRLPETTVTVTTTVTAIGLGETYGSVPSSDNFTSMGVDATGVAIGRIRSTLPQTVTITRAGGGTETFSVGAGDTNVALGAPGTYTLNIGGRSITKATGPQAFNAPTRTSTTATSSTTPGSRGGNTGCPVGNDLCR